jgi:hypothetical protein
MKIAFVTTARIGAHPYRGAVFPCFQSEVDIPTGRQSLLLQAKPEDGIHDRRRYSVADKIMKKIDNVDSN